MGKRKQGSALFTYLKKQGIEVYYDSLYVLTHAKAIVIDEEISILGSVNWSVSSLAKNWEASCLIKSRDLAKQFLVDFSRITLDPQAGGATEEEKTPGMRLGSSFLKDSSLAARMLTATDETALDLYLLLLKNFNGNPEGRIDIKIAAEKASDNPKRSYSYVIGVLQAKAREAYK